MTPPRMSRTAIAAARVRCRNAASPSRSRASAFERDGRRRSGSLRPATPDQPRLASRRAASRLPVHVSGATQAASAAAAQADVSSRWTRKGRDARLSRLSSTIRRSACRVVLDVVLPDRLDLLHDACRASGCSRGPAAILPPFL